MLGGKSFHRGTTALLFFLVVSCSLTAQTHRVRDQRIFAPYVDMGKVNNNLPQLQAESGTRWHTLAFINAGEGCVPAWSGMKTLDDDVAIRQYIQDARKGGGEFIFAFGGYEGTELGQACMDAKSLEAAYQKVVVRYQADVLDFDVEHFAIEDQSSIDRRSEALKHLAAANPKLRIQFTLPATPSGLTAQAVNVLKSAAAHGVPVDVVNIMAMDYGMPVPDGGMGANAIASAKGAMEQLKALGMDARIGITPMIGANDSAGETFTLADAKTLVEFAGGNPRIALLSFWSVGRDNGSCTGTVSPTCSGIPQEIWAFTHIFQKFH